MKIYLTVMLLVAFGLLGLMVYDSFPNFEAGDCIVLDCRNEFKPNCMYYKEVLKVGKKVYLTNSLLTAGGVVETDYISTADRIYEKVDKSFCENIKKTYR